MVKKILNNKNFKNGIWMYLLQFFNAVVPLLTIPYITRVLGKEQYGVFSVAFNLIVYLQVAVEYGFGMSATRKVAINKKIDKSKLNKLFSSVFFSRLTILCICGIICVAYCLFYHNNIQLCLSVLTLTLCLVGYCFQTNWLFQGLEEMKFISLINIIARTTSVILVFAFIRKPEHLVMYCFLYAVSPLVSGLLGFVISSVRFNVKLVKVSRHDIVNELRDGFFVFTTQLSAKVFGAIGITFLGIFAVYAEVGVFSAIQKITNIMILAWTPITQVLYPISSKKMSQDFITGKAFVYKMRRLFLPMFAIMALIVSVFSKPLVTLLFGEDYAIHYYWVIPLLLWLVLAINNNFLGIQILLGSGHDKDYSDCFQIGVICSIAFNFLLIYFFKGDGASVAPALSETVLWIALAIKVHNIEKQHRLELP